MSRPGRPRRLLAVPCDTHGAAPCPSPKGCANRRERAGLPPAQSGTSQAERRRRREPERAAARVLELERDEARLVAALAEVRAELTRLRRSEAD